MKPARLAAPCWGHDEGEDLDPHQHAPEDTSEQVLCALTDCSGLNHVPKVHMLESQPPGPWDVTVLGEEAFKQMIKSSQRGGPDHPGWCP